MKRNYSANSYNSFEKSMDKFLDDSVGGTPKRKTS